MRPFAGTSRRGRIVAAFVLGLLACSLILTACGRIPASEAAKSLPTVTPTVVQAAQAASGAFKLAETPAGNAATGQNIYVRSCQACHGAGGTASDPSQTSLVGNDGVIVKKQFDTTDKFVTAFENAAPHAGFKDDPNQNLTPARIGNIYAYLIAQMGG
ncbi:MAG TPA: c-type cytochrome [Thermomicrobiales bacterium]|jgi:mono/diheme cytochrome c family protein